MAQKKGEFEKQFQKLKDISTEMEKGGRNLDDTLKLYEDGIALYRKCHGMLQEAERKVVVLMEDATEMPFELSEE